MELVLRKAAQPSPQPFGRLGLRLVLRHLNLEGFVEGSAGTAEITSNSSAPPGQLRNWSRHVFNTVILVQIKRKHVFRHIHV